MDNMSLDAISRLATIVGPGGIVLVLWYLSDRAHERTLRQYREDMLEQRRMYENNVELVRGYSDLAKDLKDVVILNTQVVTRLCDDINRNQYCPMVRLKKDAPGSIA